MKAMFFYTLRRLFFQIIGWGMGLAFYCAIVIGFFHIVLENAAEIQKLLESLPKSLTSLVGDLSTFSTAEGYLRIRIFSIFPLLLGTFGIIVGSGLLLQDEETGRLDLLMGYPLERTAMFYGRLFALILSIIVIICITWCGILIGMYFSVMDIDIFKLTPTLFSLFAIVLFFTVLSLMLSMFLSSRIAAAMVTGLTMLITQVISNLANISTILKPLAIISPFEYYQGTEAIKDFHWGYFAILITGSLLLIFIAYMRFASRDIRVAGEGELSWKKFSLSIATVIFIFTTMVFQVTKDKSFTSPQSCFETANKSLQEHDWKKLCKTLTPETIDYWTGDMILRGGMVMLDIGDDGIIRAIKNPPMQLQGNFPSAFQEEKLMANALQLQIAMANVDFKKFLNKIELIEKYSQNLFLTREEICQLGTIVKDKPAFLKSILQGIADFRSFIPYQNIQNVKISKNKADAVATTKTNDQVQISFTKIKDQWKIAIPFPDIFEEHPLEEYQTEDLYDYTLHSNIVYDTKNNLTLDAYIPNTKEKKPAILLIHGGGWRMGDKKQLSQYGHLLAKEGYACFSINYRLAPQHKFPAQIEDCQKALLWIRKNNTQYNIDSEKIGAVGYSAGAHLAALTGVIGKQEDNTHLKVTVTGGTPTNFMNIQEKVTQFNFLFGGSPLQNKENYQRASPENYISENTIAMGFFHGTEDMLVSLDGPLSPWPLYKQLKKMNVTTEFHKIKTVGHFEGIYHKESLDFTLKFLNAHLKK